MRTIAFVFIFLFSAVLLFWHAWVKSPTYDEGGHLQCGYYHWQHLDFERGLEHPPLVRLWAALPLNFLSLQDPETSSPLFLDKPLSIHREILYGMFLVFKNARVSAEKIMILSRGMVILLTFTLFLGVGWWSKKLYGVGSGFFSFSLMATLPPFLAHGSLVTTDVGGALAALFFLYRLSRFLEVPSRANLWYCGVLLGLAQASKLSNLLLYPILAFSLFFLFDHNSSLHFNGVKYRILQLLKLILISFLIINLAYGFQNFLPPHLIHPEELAAYQWPAWIQSLYRWMPLPDFYLKSVGFVLYHMQQGFQTFFMGEIYSQGRWYYFPVLFAIKTPVSVLIVCCVFLYSFLKLPLRKDEKILILAALLVLAVSIHSNLNLGIRHFLLFYPLFLILSGRILLIFQKDYLRRIVVGTLILLQSLEVLFAAPHFLGFINIAAGGPKNGYQLVLDGDWGQDLKLLSHYLKKNPAETVLSYFGTALPEYYGIAAQELLPTGTQIHSGHVNSTHPNKEILAISLSHLQGLMVGRETFDWLRKKEPTAILGHSIYVFDITTDTESHRRLAQIYTSRGESQKAEHHLKRLE